MRQVSLISRTGCLALAVVSVLLTCGPALGDGLIIIDPPFWPPVPPWPRPPWPRPPRPPPHPVFAPLEVKYHRVTVKISDQVAMTTVDQAFYNPNDQRLEGTYVFPLPAGAQIDKFSMEVDGKSVDAELVDADKARRLYEEIVRKARDPALLEYAGQGLFKVRIFPIEPRSEKRVRMSYTELLRSDAELAEYVYPLNTEKFSAQPIPEVAIKIELECARPIRALYSPSHAVEISRPGERRAIVGFESRQIRPDTDFHLLFSTETRGEVGLSVLSFRDGAESEGYAALLITPPPVVSDNKIVPKDVIFVLDTSGSMAEGNKLEQAKKALLFCLKNLNADDRFEIVRFSTEAEPLFGRLVGVAEETRGRAEAFVQKLKPAGGTAIEDALRRALDPVRAEGRPDRPYLVVFLTDGKPTVGTTDEDRLVANVVQAMGDRPVRVFCFGIGADVNTHLLDRLAEKTRAASRYVLPSEDLELKVSSFYAKISDPVLAALKLTVSGPVKLSKVYPSELPDLFKGDQLVVLARYEGHGRASLVLEGAVQGNTQRFTAEAEFPETKTDSVFLPRLWATRRIGYLLDQIRLHGENAELREEVTDLARRYGIVTPYTAYLIVEDEERRRVPEASRVLPALRSDRDARRAAEGLYREATIERSGAGAVGGAMAYDALKSAAQAAAPAEAGQLAFRSVASRPGGPSPDVQRMREALDAAGVRHIKGRSFYWTGDRWVDALAQRHADAPRVRVRFNTDEYFALLGRHPQAAPWLAVGASLEIWLDGVLYEISEEE